jgi:hypothetical protein
MRISETLEDFKRSMVVTGSRLPKKRQPETNLGEIVY